MASEPRTVDRRSVGHDSRARNGRVDTEIRFAFSPFRTFVIELVALRRKGGYTLPDLLHHCIGVSRTHYDLFHVSEKSCAH
jgi:hypothetical protein